MNWARNNRFLAGFLAVIVVVGGVLTYLLISAQGRYSEVSGQYDTQVAEMKRLQEQKMFPNDANVKKYEQVRKDYQEEVNKLQNTLATYTTAADKTLTPLQFQDTLRQKVEAVVNKAQTAQIGLPDGFYLGFEQYRGAPPETAATPLLTAQLNEIENLVNLLISLHIEKITALKRALLPQETGGAASTASTARPAAKGNVAPADPLVSKYPFEIAYTAAPSAFRDSLNKITSDKTLYIIRALQVKNQADKGPSRIDSNPNLPSGASTTGAPTQAAAGAVDANGVPVPPLPGSTQPALRYVVGQERLDILARIELATIKPLTSSTR